MYKEEYKILYKNAEKLNSWYTLIPYQYLLFSWQTKHPQDIKNIATIASHRLGHHKWCKDCTKVQAFIDKYTLGQKRLA